MTPEQINITDIIPQRPPFVMIDKLTHSDEQGGQGELFIKETNVLCNNNGFFSESGIIEFIAQTAAAHIGYYQFIAKQEIKKGYIGAVKNLVIKHLPKIHTKIRSEIIIDNVIVGYTIIIGKVYHENNIIAECEMRIILDTNIK